MCHVRHVSSSPNNEMRFGKKKAEKRWSSRFLKIFKRNVYNPNSYLKIGWHQKDLCLPTAIILSFYKTHAAMKKISQAQLMRELQSLRFQGLIDSVKGGIQLSKIGQLEALNSPLPNFLTQKFPVLRHFDGISINVFRIEAKKDNVRIFPVRLSENYKKNSHWQIDLLMDSDLFYTNNQSINTSDNHSDHFLYVYKISWLLQSFLSYGSNRHLMSYVCKSCLSLKRTSKELIDHHLVCNAFPGSGKVFHRRRSNNVLVHRPIIMINNYSYKNGLRFERKRLKNMLLPLSTSFADFEAVNSLNFKDDDKNAPNQSVFRQDVIGISISHKSNYDEFPLPNNLAIPRCLFRDEAKVAENDFFLSILLQMRKDHILLNDHLKNTIQSDRGKPEWFQLTLAEKIFVMTRTYCILCGRQFNKIYRNKKTNKLYRVRKCIDHVHFWRHTDNFRTVLCSGKT